MKSDSYYLQVRKLLFLKETELKLKRINWIENTFIIQNTKHKCILSKLSKAFFINTVIVYLQQLSGKTRKSTSHFAKLSSDPFGYTKYYHKCYLGTSVIQGFWDDNILPLLGNEDSQVNGIGT